MESLSPPQPTDAGAAASTLDAAPPAPAESARVVRNRRRDSHLRRLLVTADLISFSGALWISALIHGSDTLQPAIVATPLLLVMAAKLVGLYDRDAHLTHKTTLEEVPSLFSLAAFSVLGVFLGGAIFTGAGFGPAEALGLLLALFAGMVLFRAAARRLWRATEPPERCLLVGNTSREQELREALALSEAAHATLVGVIPVPQASGNGANGGAQIPPDILDALEVDRVIVSPGSRGSDELLFVIRALRDAGVKVSVIPDLSRLAGTSVEVDAVAGITMLGMRRFAISRSSRLIKRGFDVVASSVLLLVLSPLLAVIALAIRFEQPGSPVLFRQSRIGRYGRRFQIFKFRTMCDGAHSQRAELEHLDRGANGFFKIPDDPRVTRVGRWLRGSNLDELPQLLNVLRGEMSIVGPRPLIPEEDRNVAGRYRRRLDVRPGITGHWQVLGSARVPLDEMVKLDYLYVSNWSLWSDLMLIVRTIPLVTRRRGM